jgi:hypothetical protein
MLPLVLEVTNQALHGLNLLKPELPTFMPRDVLRVDEAERGLAADVRREVRLDVALLLQPRARAGLRGRGIKADHSIMRVDRFSIRVHHHQTGVSHDGARLVHPPAQGVRGRHQR